MPTEAAILTAKDEEAPEPSEGQGAFTTQMLDRYGDALIGIRIGDAPLPCRRCGQTETPFVVELDTAHQPHEAGAWCRMCMDRWGAAFIKWLPKDGIRRRPGIPAGLRWRVIAAADFRCAYCRRHRDQLEDGEYLHVDHIIPVAAGGKTEQGNLVCACSSCNLGKSDSLPGEGHNA